MKNNQLSFDDYWKEKAQKRRKSWVARAKRFGEEHLKLETIRNEVFYHRLEQDAMSSLYDVHQTVQNPVAGWDSNMRFFFSEQGLRSAMQAEGADISTLTMTLSRKSIVGQKPHAVEYANGINIANNRHDLYGKCTDLETCNITFKDITMVIYRYSYLQQPFAWYELLPCKQLPFSMSRFEETSFSTLNIATLLMEVAAEFELRNEELNYHAKKLKLRTMEAALTCDIEFELWNDKKLEKKVAEYVNKNYTVEKALGQVLASWKQAIAKYFHAITDQELQNSAEKFNYLSMRNSPLQYIKGVLQPYFNGHGLEGVKIWISKESSSDLHLEYLGHQLLYKAHEGWFFPNVNYSMCHIYGVLDKAPLRALAGYLRKMPEITRKTDEVVIKVMHLYDRLMQQKHENYRRNVELLDTLATQHAGTPVGKMMKYLRWNAGRFVIPGEYTEFSIPTLKVLGDNSFSFVEKKYLQGISKVNGQQPRASQDEVRERWLDADCQTVYVADPVTTDFDEWVITHRRGIFVKRFSWSVKDFLNIYSTSGSDTFLSIDFINQNL